MSKKRFGFRGFLLAVMLIVMTAVPAFAAGNNEPFYDNTVTGSQTGSVFVSGETVNSDAEVDGILFAAGNGVNAGGKSEYAMTAGNHVEVSGEVEKDAFAAGRIVDIRSHVGRSLFAAAQDINITGNVDGSVYAAASSVRVDGTVGGDLYVSAGKINIADTAVIKGRLHYNSDAEITAPEAVLSGAEVTAGTGVSVEVSTVNSGEDRTADLMDSALDKVFGYLGLVFVAMILFWLTPLWGRLEKEYEGKTFGSYAAAFGIGFGVLAAAPIAAILLMFSRFGLRFAFILILLYIAVILAAPIFAAFFVGKLVWRNLAHQSARIWAELLIGIALYKVLSMIPYAGWVVGLIAVPFGVGAALLLVLHSKRKYDEIPPALPETRVEYQ